jgi:hypothetical protein
LYKSTLDGGKFKGKEPVGIGVGDLRAGLFRIEAVDTGSGRYTADRALSFKWQVETCA